MSGSYWLLAARHMLLAADPTYLIAKDMLNADTWAVANAAATATATAEQHHHHHHYIHHHQQTASTPARVKQTNTLATSKEAECPARHPAACS